jgi:hypothetical protein
MEAFNFVVANEDHNLYIFDMRYVLSENIFLSQNVCLAENCFNRFVLNIN